MKKAYQFFIIILFCSALFTGCGPPRLDYYSTDDWTGERMWQLSVYGFSPMTEEEYIAWFKTQPVIRDDEGHKFKTLRSKVAYEAAKGIKEERHRIITGE